MMTMLVATVGLLPAATSHGIDSDSQRPFAIVIVGGLMVAPVMNVFLLQALACRHECRKRLPRRRKARAKT
jgi:cobalt-zinc-cadmium resistance protein CzcA